MAETLDGTTNVMPSAAPSDAEIATWQALPRDQQQQQLRAALTQPDCSVPSSATMKDILGRAQAKAESRHGWV